MPESSDDTSSDGDALLPDGLVLPRDLAGGKINIGPRNEWVRLNHMQQGLWDAIINRAYPQETVADIVRREMEAKGLTCTAVAARARISRSYLSQLLHGRRKPSRDTLIRIAFGLMLDGREASNLLERGGFCRLREDVRRDVVIYWLLCQRSDLSFCEEVLAEIGETPLLG